MEMIIETIVDRIPYVLAMIVCLPVHELAHGLVANWLGDDTAYYQGRLSLNPFAHLDLFGSLSMLVFGYGWAKPVPVNPRRFKCNMRLGMALTAVAGPLSNLIMSFLFMVLLKVSNLVAFATEQEFFFFLGCVFAILSTVNIGLCFFNLLPIPPLDGSRILNYFLPYRAQQFMDKMEYYSQYILIGVLLVSSYTGILSEVVGIPIQGVMWLFDKATFFLGEGVYYDILGIFPN